MEHNREKMMTVTEAAKELGVDASVVRRYLRTRKIPRKKVYGKREKLIEASLYADKLREDGYIAEADRLGAWLVKQTLKARENQEKGEESVPEA